jgi:hypothetical protein
LSSILPLFSLLRHSDFLNHENLGTNLPSLGLGRRCG